MQLDPFLRNNKKTHQNGCQRREYYYIVTAKIKQY